jgi:hypothetical protein
MTISWSSLGYVVLATGGTVRLEYVWYRSQLAFTAYLISQQIGISYGTGKSRDLLTDRDNRNALLVCHRFILQIEKMLLKIANIIRHGMCVNYFTSSALLWWRYPLDFFYYAYQLIPSIFGSFGSLLYRQWSLVPLSSSLACFNATQYPHIGKYILELKATACQKEPSSLWTMSLHVWTVSQIGPSESYLLLLCGRWECRWRLGS